MWKEEKTQIMSLETVEKTVNKIARALSAQKAVGYLYGDLVKYRHSSQNQHLRENVIDVVISYLNEFDIHQFYQRLSSEMTINAEIEHTNTKYHILAEGYILRFEMIKGFDPRQLESVRKIARFTVDSIFHNVHTKEIVDYSNEGIGHLSSSPVVIKSIVEDWNASDCLGFAEKISQFDNAVVEAAQLEQIKKVDILSLDEPATKSFKDILLDILVSYAPGKALDFIVHNFSGGREWAFTSLFNLMSSINMPIKEGLDADEIFSEKKLQLVDVYNEFYLFDKNRSETPKERTHRLHTTLRLLFDTPTLNVSIPYIDKVSVVTASLEEEGSVTFRALQDDELCPYGICPDCVPEDCDPQCCCCSTVDIVRDAKTACHSQITLSCAVDSGGNLIGFDIPPYDPEDPYQGSFPPGCDECETACETVLGIRPGFDYCQNWEATGAAEGWWTIPAGNWPCSCHCASTMAGAPGNCELTCVTCEDFFCNSDVEISGHDCYWNVSLIPGDGCCGSPAVTDWIFVIDFSGSMSAEIAQVRNEIDVLVDLLAETGIGIRVGLVSFGRANPEPAYELELTDDIQLFKDTLAAIPTDGGTEWDIEATYFAATQADWRGHANFIVLVGDEPTQYRAGGNCGAAGSECLDNTKTVLDWFNITVYVADEFSNARQELVDHTGGRRFDILGSFSDLFNDLDIAVYPTSCKCMDTTPVPLVRDLSECECPPFDHDCLGSLPQHCYDIPVTIFYPGDTIDCTLPVALRGCRGETLIIEPGPDESNALCCSELNGHYGLGCDCLDCEEEPCCGATCFNICEEFPNDQFPWGTEEGRRAIVDAIWLDCWDKKAQVDRDLYPNCDEPCCPDGADPGDRNFPCARLRDPNDPACQGDMQQVCQDLLDQGYCCDCPDQSDCCSCCLLFPDGNCDITVRHCFDTIKNDVIGVITNVCLTGGETQPPPTWEPPSLKCLQDRCVVGEPDINPNDRDSIDNQCDQIYKGCTSVRHPSVVVLNNGIGLVAYEAMENSSTIKIQQFKTTVQEKIMPNREFNFGRLQNPARWSTQSGDLYRSPRLYYYEDIPQHLVSSGDNPPDPNDPDSWGDAIVFKTGPLEKQFFPIAPDSLGSDDIGNYIRFFVPSDVELTNPFSSSDDAYDVKFFILDSEDAPDNNKGFIGDSDDVTTDGADFIFSDRRQVDEELLRLSHIYNGEEVPVAFPSLATAYNYADGLENAHWLYLVYQAFEDSKWNIYMRQIRLSEYSREQQIDAAIGDGTLITLEDLGISDVTLRVFCTSDECRELDEQEYLLNRTVVMEVLIADGREVYSNPDLSGNWPSLCAGYISGDFDKSKIFVQFTHSVVADRCPDQFDFDEIFYNWKVGHEFTSPASSISATGLFSVMALPNDSSVEIGSYDPPITVGNSIISSSSVGVNYYQNSSDTAWSVIADPALDILSQFKGFDVSEPIVLTAEEMGHATRPVVKVNYNNDVFVAYESTETDLHQIKIKGTNSPSSSLPIGVFTPRNLDATLSFFYGPSDFTYELSVTSDGINQLPDMFIDFNDVVHLTWQSNRDSRWEIYYAASDTGFLEKRITNHAGKSLQPSIDGDNRGRLYIAWHDDRFGDYEIMMAYYLGSRVIPLAQQDPYLAAIRNDGYAHYLNEIALRLVNETNFSACYKDVIVDFYNERTLQTIAFSVAMSDYPIAFTSSAAQSDSSTETFLGDSDGVLASWTEVAVSGGEVLTSPEFDTGLSGSFIDTVFVDYELFAGGDTVEVAFKASDTPSDALADWTDYAPISDSVTTNYSSFGIPEAQGRYKQMRIRKQYTTTSPAISTITIVSESRNRICLAPGAETIVYLDLTPEIRVDKLGSETAEFPLPIGFARNNTYFVGVRVIDDENITIEMPDQQAAASCDSCSADDSTWNMGSCSIKTELVNDTSSSILYNLKYEFYYDEDKQYKATEFLAFPNESDLSCFTVDGQPAEDEWTSSGLNVSPDISRQIILWPSLSPTAGLICGIHYHVSILACFASESDPECTEADLVSFDNVDWVCNCQSLRWDARFEDSPVNLREVVRWRSSGDGGSDTRLTETIGANSLNPEIRIRSNLNGLVLYESNRRELNESSYDANTYRVYASVFSIIPRSEMYASASQNISSAFDSIVFRSDIPICPNTADFFCTADTDPCDSCYDNQVRKPPEQFLRGHNVALDIDQFDSIFLAAEVPYKNDQIECNEFIKDRQQYIVIHSCGANALDLFRDIDEETGVTEGCNPSEIVGRTYLGTIDPTFRSIVLKIRVRNDHVSYHINRGEIPMAVTDRCLVDFEVVAIPETVAIRLRNAGSDWADWVPFHPDVGENTMFVKDWRLSAGSGIKLVEFQAATNAGLSQSGSVNLVADYARIDHQVRFYKPLTDTPTPDENVELATLVSDQNIWVESNVLPTLNGVPVAALRSPTTEGEGDEKEIVIPATDYVFVEIEPGRSYVESIADFPSEEKLAIFDFIQQGGADEYNLPTVLYEETGRLLFRGVIQLYRDNQATARDGLAYIIPHFSHDCSDAISASVTQSSEFEKDSLNTPVSGVPESVVEQDDIFDRDDAGRVKYAIVIRPSEDPYFIFGDPNYRLETNE
jgi:hypothetical protein